MDGVTVVRGGATVLRDVTLLAADGELIVVLGSSGSGKTTLLRVVAGLDGVSSGEVLIRGRRVTRLPSGERHVAMVFQSSALLPFLDVAHNLGWSLRVQHRPEAEVQERVSGRARQLRLSRLLGRRPGQLSGGERGLVGIGRALVQVPDVLLLDEPLGDLDAVQRVEVRRQIVEVARSLGVPTFYVTHDPAEGLAIADRVALLHEGRIVQVGRPRELYERPVDLFVAEFIGAPQIGLLPARLVSAGGQAGFRVGARTLPLWQAVPPPLLGHVGREVVLGLRAEDVHPAEAGRDPDAVALDAVVSHVEYTGRQNVVAVQVEAAPDDPGGGLLGGGPSGGTLHSFFPPRAVIRSGDAVRITVDATRAHVFDPATGRALLHPPDRS
ncbi:ABC transporter ATP-binding protein [Geodermatophilus obscurus]|uniref:ABC transporter ATP-binding protein n=1 Tax=Geodermatophilus obscurus TaxID=1861 RepID=UPI0015A6F5E1|nr:ABC transporter ATP-binding protein [Geodermatophilus obscurus]